jgi:hydrogenase maturation protease
MTRAKTILIAGIGNDYRRDDGVGRAIVRTIGAWQDPRIEVRLSDRSGMELINDWKDYGSVYVIDAVISGQAPGRMSRFTVPPQELPATLFCASTHAFNLADVVRLAGTLDALPRKLIIYGVEIQDIGHGQGLTPAVRKGAETVLRRVAEELNVSCQEYGLLQHSCGLP